jgi:hypothetical protein
MQCLAYEDKEPLTKTSALVYGNQLVGTVTVVSFHGIRGMVESPVRDAWLPVGMAQGSSYQ